VAIPRQATTSAARKDIEHGRSFRKLVKWRTGCEGRVGYLKRGYGWDRTRLDGKNGAAIWCRYGIFTHNLSRSAPWPADPARPSPRWPAGPSPNSALRLFRPK
jgi:IS5 family transposase